LAQDLLDRGLAFNAHEVLEAAWKNGPSEERMLWQGLAQLAVGITHIQRGNLKGAVTVLHRASTRLAHGDRQVPYGVDASAWWTTLTPSSMTSVPEPRSPPSTCGLACVSPATHSYFDLKSRGVAVPELGVFGREDGLNPLG
jgi:hypothetical protein